MTPTGLPRQWARRILLKYFTVPAPSVAAAVVCLWGSQPFLRAAESRAPAPPVSSGLVNDWLRSENPAAAAWDVGGQFRARYEVKENAGSFPNRDFLSGLDNDNDYFLFRTKVHLGWGPAPWASVFAEGRDAHAVSDERPIPETDSFDLYQAYVRLGDPKRFPLSLKAGRQELIYGDERYIGVADWSNFGRSFDALKLRFENDLFWLDAIAGRPVLPNDGEFNVVNDYDWLLGLYGSTRKLLPWQDTELFFLSRNVGSGSPTAINMNLGGPGPRDIYTAGTRWKSVPGQFGRWDYTLEAAGQFGSVNSQGVRLEHRAYAANLSGGYTWIESFGAPRVWIGYDFGSGDSNPFDDRNETLELLFGTNHKLYGLMDVLGTRNLHIPRFGGTIKPLTDLTVTLEWLGFWMVETPDFLYPESGAGRNQNGYGRNPGFSSYVGNEVDLIFNWRAVPWGQLQAGYGHFFAGEYLRETAAVEGRAAEDADWVYLQATFSF